MFEVCQHVSATVAANPSCSEYLFVWVEFDVVVVVVAAAAAAVAVTVVSVAVVFAYGPKTGPAFLLFLRCDMLGG